MNQAFRFLRKDRLDQSTRHSRPIFEGDVMPQPLPSLGTADFKSGQIFHEIVEGDAALILVPTFHVGDADANISTQSFDCSGADALGK